MWKLLQNHSREKFEFFLADQEIIYWGVIWHKLWRMAVLTDVGKKMSTTIEKNMNLTGQDIFWAKYKV